MKVFLNAISKYFLLLSAICLLSACCAVATKEIFFTSKAVTVISTDLLQVTRKGTAITVLDLAGEAEYGFNITRHKKSDVLEETKKTACTDTIDLYTLPGCGIKIKEKATGTIYTIYFSSRY